MSVLDALKTDESINNETDSLGGYNVFDSGIYPFTVKQAYVTLSPKKAMAINALFVTADKKELKAQFYVTSNEDKGCKNYYVNSKTGEKHYLPGFNQADALCLLTTKKNLNKLSTEKKIVNLYSPEQKKQVPTEVDMIMELIGKQIFAGVIKQKVDKRKQDPNTGKYKPTGETREENEIDKFFRASDKRTVVEIRAQKKNPEFFDQWAAKWEGQIRDKTDKTAPTPGAPKRETGDQAPTTDLFG